MSINKFDKRVKGKASYPIAERVIAKIEEIIDRLNSNTSDITQNTSDISSLQPAYAELEIMITGQSGTNAPTISILKNTLGEVPVEGYNDVGIYTLTTTGLFGSSADKCIILTGTEYTANTRNYVEWADANTILISTRDNTNTHANALVYMYSINIKVYP